MSSYRFEVARAALGTTRVIELPALAALSPAAGEAVLTVDKFALTANNITYGVAGDMIGYWQFFPAEGDWGQIPVWGKGTVVLENDSGLNIGDEFYGYFPMASYLVVEPVHATERGFTDGAAHRQALPGVYNNYALMTAGNGFDRQFDDHQMIYRPLFTTSFVIDDYLFDNDHFGASNIILSSASSKTSFGLAFLLRKNRDVKVTGLTSAANKAFVESLNLYDQVVAYDALDTLDVSENVAFVDMAGNRQVLEALHHHFGDKMVCSCGVGITHWESRDGQPPSILPGAKPKMFFAPDQIQKRNQDWGPQKFQAELSAAWQAFLVVVDGWVSINHRVGQGELEETFQEVLAGAKPDQAFVVSLE